MSNRKYLGRSKNHISFGSPIKIRLNAIWNVLTSKNFILIYKIKEFEEDGRRGRELTVSTLTEYDCESDQLSCYGAIDIIKKTIL